MTRGASPLPPDEDGVARCPWGRHPEIYRTYHDTEWGRPVVDDQRLFEKLCLEGFQAGLSWLTILRKREAFRAAFAGFDPARVAGFTARDVDRLVVDSAIVRHRGKIESTINNARRYAELVADRGSLAAHVWSFEPTTADRPRRMTSAWLAAHPTSPASVRLSRDLKRRGWTFVGPTTVHAFLQAMGVVDDHLEGCHVRDAVERQRRALHRPHPREGGR
jgi:DNA-3-methyladenine glycosylase I